MIQRIQSVFLLIAAILLVFLVLFPFAEMVRSTDQNIFELGFKGLVNASGGDGVTFSSISLSILMIICLLITIGTIFLYKKRMLQIRFSVFNIILLLGLQGLMYYYFRVAQTTLSGSGTFSLFFVFPLVAAILVFLALRAISRDEALIRSLDRLR
jgi:hypothetical protein